MREEGRPEELRVDRRRFCGLGVKGALTLAAMPAASSLLAGCGGSDERGDSSGEPAAAAETGRVEATSPPNAEGDAAAVPGESGSEAALVTEVAAAASMVQALQYVNESPKADQQCANCQLYTAGAGGRGKCQLFAQGRVKETGWCVSWVAKMS